jgi:hypothetical protein
MPVLLWSSQRHAAPRLVCGLLQVSLDWLPYLHCLLCFWRPLRTGRQSCGQALLCYRLPLADGECQMLICLPSTIILWCSVIHDNCLPWCVHQLVRLTQKCICCRKLLIAAAATFCINFLLTWICECGGVWEPPSCQVSYCVFFLTGKSRLMISLSCLSLSPPPSTF